MALEQLKINFKIFWYPTSMHYLEIQTKMHHDRLLDMNFILFLSYLFLESRMTEWCKKKMQKSTCRRKEGSGSKARKQPQGKIIGMMYGQKK